MKHVMLSYQWNSQELVKRVYELLKTYGVPVWMDIEGGMGGDINDSMAQGVDNAAVICCFMNEDYVESKNCKRELSYADSADVPIVPCMCAAGWKSHGWLGILTAGLLWIDFRQPDNINKSISSLTREIMHRAGSSLVVRPRSAASTSWAVVKKADLEKKPGRAFKNSKTGLFLAESGEVKVHEASGHRSTLTLLDDYADACYWIEEHQGKGSEILYFKNYVTGSYLGFDPNGDYVYTKSQHYGAEEWILTADETTSSGERSVVIFANYGKKHLAVVDGQLTGVSHHTPECVWELV
eukprot:Opistho-2@36966